MHIFWRFPPNREKNVKKIQDKEKYCAAGDQDRQRTKHPPRKCFRCGSVDHIISECPNPPKYNNKRQNNVRFNEGVNRASKK